MAVDWGWWKRWKGEGSKIFRIFIRVRFALPISKPLRRGGFIADSDGERMWVKFEYERLPIFCYFCGFLGRDLCHYVSHFVAKKNSGEIIMV